MVLTSEIRKEQGASLVKYPIAVLLRLINIFLNAGTGIILARTLSVDARGQVAALSSVTGVAVVLCTSANVERTLKYQKSVSEYRYPLILSNFWKFLLLAVCISVLILNIAREYAALVCFFTLILIFLSNFNTVLNAMIYDKKQIIVNQIFLVSLTITYCAILLSYSMIFRLTVLSWFTVIILTNFLIFVLFLLYLRRKRVRLKIDWKFDEHCLTTPKRTVFEISAIYSSALSLQILLVSLSQILPMKNVAEVAVLMSLVSIVGTPLAPILPNLLAYPKENMDLIFKMPTKKLLVWAISCILCVSVLSGFAVLAFPYIYGAQYTDLTKAVPYVFFYGSIFTALQYLSTLARGSNNYHVSCFLNVGPILFILVLVAFQSISISQFFLFLGLANLVAVITSYLFLQRGQSVKQR